MSTISDKQPDTTLHEGMEKVLARCEDGVVRTIYLNRHADTFFSITGRTKIRAFWHKGVTFIKDGEVVFTSESAREDGDV